jgi:hypothetical protein
MSYHVSPTLMAARDEIARSQKPYLSGLGAAGAPSIASMDAAARAAFPTSVKTFINKLPFSAAVRNGLLQSPVATMTAAINTYKNKWVEMVDLALSYGNLRNAKVKVGAATVNMPNKVEYTTPPLKILETFMGVAAAKPDAAFEAILVKMGGVRRSIASGAIWPLKLALGVGRGSLKGYHYYIGDAADPGADAAVEKAGDDWSAQDVQSIVKDSGVIATAVAGVVQVAGSVLLPIIQGLTGQKPKQPDKSVKDQKVEPPGGGAQVEVTPGLPGWVLPAALVGGAFFFMRKKR